MSARGEDGAWHSGTSAAASPKREATVLQSLAMSMLQQGRLPGIASFHQLACSKPDGTRIVETIGVDLQGECDWHVSGPPAEECADHKRLLVEHARWLIAKSAGAELCRTFLDIAERRLAGSDCAIAAGGVSVANPLNASLPEGVMLVEARGHDTRPQLRRLASTHPYDIDAALDRLVGLDRRAAVVAAEWAVADAIAAIEAPALALADTCGLKIHELIARLGDEPRVTFGAVSAPLQGSFSWRDCAIRVAANHRSGWTIDGEVLTIRGTKLAHVFRNALTGSPLSQLATIAELPADLVIAAVEAAGEDLRVTLERRRTMVHRRPVDVI